jgi:hypothetical protein
MSDVNCRWYHEEREARPGIGTAAPVFRQVRSCARPDAGYRWTGDTLVSVGPDGYGCRPAESGYPAGTEATRDGTRPCGPGRTCYAAPDG